MDVVCPLCAVEMVVEVEWVGESVECPGCGEGFTISAPLPLAPAAVRPRGSRAAKARGAAVKSPAPARYEYRVLTVNENLWAALFFGQAALKEGRIQSRLNTQGAEGWDMVFQVVESRRVLLLWSRQTMIITMRRPLV